MTALLRKLRMRWIADNVMTIFLFIAVGCVVLTVANSALMRRDLAIFSAQMDAKNEQTNARFAETNKRLDEYDADHVTTLNIVNTLKDMSGNMKTMMDRPPQITSIAVTPPARRLAVKKKGKMRQCTQNALRIKNFGSSYLVFTDIVPAPCKK